MGRYIEAKAHLDTWSLTASLYERMKDFDTITMRQDTPGSPHKDTRAIFLRGPVMGPEIVRTWFEDVEQIDYIPAWDWPEARAMLNLLAGIAPLGLGKAMIVELKPGGSIGWHVDEGAYAAAHVRWHLPLVTNPLAFLYSGGEHAHVPAGALTRFDTSVMHSAVNLGQYPRIHLIVDARKVKE